MVEVLFSATVFTENEHTTLLSKVSEGYGEKNQAFTERKHVTVVYSNHSQSRYGRETWTTSLLYVFVQVYPDFCTVKTMNF